jgi:hypothetical protein
VKELLVVNDNVIHRDHTNADVVIQKIYQHVAGYHTDDHADDLHTEPLLTAILAKERLASQPTLSRFHAKSGDKTIKSLEKITEDLQRRVYKAKPENHVIFDVDSSGFIAMKHWYPMLLFLFEVIVVLPRLNYMNWLKHKKSTISFV